MVPGVVVEVVPITITSAPVESEAVLVAPPLNVVEALVCTVALVLVVPKMCTGAKVNAVPDVLLTVPNAMVWLSNECTVLEA